MLLDTFVGSQERRQIPSFSWELTLAILPEHAGQHPICRYLRVYQAASWILTIQALALAPCLQPIIPP
jgi:hypothetical protein